MSSVERNWIKEFYKSGEKKNSFYQKRKSGGGVHVRQYAGKIHNGDLFYRDRDSGKMFKQV